MVFSSIKWKENYIKAIRFTLNETDLFDYVKEFGNLIQVQFEGENDCINKFGKKK